MFNALCIEDLKSARLVCTAWRDALSILVRCVHLPIGCRPVKSNAVSPVSNSRLAWEAFPCYSRFRLTLDGLIPPDKLASYLKTWQAPRDVLAVDVTHAEHSQEENATALLQALHALLVPKAEQNSHAPKAQQPNHLTELHAEVASRGEQPLTNSTSTSDSSSLGKGERNGAEACQSSSGSTHMETSASSSITEISNNSSTAGTNSSSSTSTSNSKASSSTESACTSRHASTSSAAFKGLTQAQNHQSTHHSLQHLTAAPPSPTPNALLLQTDISLTSLQALQASSVLPNLKGLALYSVEYTGPQVTALAAHLPNLESLHIRVQGYSHQLSHLGSLTCLTSLHLSCHDASSSALSRGALQLRQLRRLQLSGSIVLQPVLGLTMSCSHLEELQLSQALPHQQVGRSGHENSTHNCSLHIRIWIVYA